MTGRDRAGPGGAGRGRAGPRAGGRDQHSVQSQQGNSITSYQQSEWARWVLGGMGKTTLGLDMVSPDP